MRALQCLDQLVALQDERKKMFACADARDDIRTKYMDLVLTERETAEQQRLL